MAPTSNEAGGYNNWYWYGTVWDAAANAWRADINIANFNGASSNYVTHIYVYDNAENCGTKYDLGAVYIKAPGLSASEFKLGDYVAYQPNTAADATYSTYQDGAERSGFGTQTISRDTSLNWRVMAVNGNTVSLVSEVISTTYLCLQGANGYNNGVKLLNDACNALYSNSYLGAIGRSMNVDDVNGLMGVTEATKKSIAVYYGNEYTASNKYYPQIFQYEVWGSIDGNYTGTLKNYQQYEWYNNSTNTQASVLRGIYSAYRYDLRSYKAESTVEYALCRGIRPPSGYDWPMIRLASRYAEFSPDPKHVNFGLFNLNINDVIYSWMYNSYGSGIRSDGFIRPCVDIDLSRVYIGITGTGESTNPYSIQAR